MDKIRSGFIYGSSAKKSLDWIWRYGYWEWIVKLVSEVDKFPFSAGFLVPVPNDTKKILDQRFYSNFLICTELKKKFENLEIFLPTEPFVNTWIKNPVRWKGQMPCFNQKFKEYLSSAEKGPIILIECVLQERNTLNNLARQIHKSGYVGPLYAWSLFSQMDET